jgi:CRISPR-associated protein Cas2
MNTQTWLIAYDIRQPRRLSALHRLLKKHALAVQYSVFVGRFTRRGIRHLQAQISSIIAPEDDVRLYPLPHRPDWVFYGRRPLPEGVYLPEPSLPGLASDPEVSTRPRKRQPQSQPIDDEGGKC